MNQIAPRKRLRANILDTAALRSTILTTSSRHDSSGVPRPPTNEFGYHPTNSHNIESVYGRGNRFRTLRREKGSNHSRKQAMKMTLNHSRIENSFNNIIINFSDHNKPHHVHSIGPNSDRHKLLFERKARSKDYQTIGGERRYPHSRVLSERQQDLSSTSLAIKEKVAIPEEHRASKSRAHKKRKSDARTLQHEDTRPQSRPQTTKLDRSQPLEKLMNNFINSFQEILLEPINLETFETKEMQLQRKMEVAACNILARTTKRSLQQVWRRITASAK